MGAEVFHALKKTLHDARARRRRSATRAASRPTSSPTRRRCEVLVAGIEAAGYTPGRRRRDRARPGRQRDLRRTAPTCSSTRAARSRADELADYWAELAGRYPIVSIEDGMDEEDWDGWKALTERARRHASSSSATTSSSPTPSACSAASTRGVGQLDPRSRSTRSARSPRRSTAIAHGARRRLHGGHVAPLGRDRGRDDRRPRGGHRLRADQDRRAVALGPRREVQPAAAHRGGSSAPTPTYPGRSRLPRAEPRVRARAGRTSACTGSAGQERPRARTRPRWPPPAAPSRAHRAGAPVAPRSPRRAPAALVAGGARGIRWDRIGRVALLVVLFGIVVLYVGPARSYVVRPGARPASGAPRSARLQRENKRLLARRATCAAAALEREARRLGMVKPGERPFVIEPCPGTAAPGANARSRRPLGARPAPGVPTAGC